MSAKEREESLNFGNGIDLIDTIKAVLESGNSVELNATGYSMFPTLRPGDRVIVKPFTKGELPKPGSVVVYRDNNALVIHRLIEVQNNNGEHVFITRGDSRQESDKPWTIQRLLGEAVSYKHAKMDHFVKTFIPGGWRYKYNRRILWVYFKTKRLLNCAFAYGLWPT
jgi:signal peptidase I